MPELKIKNRKKINGVVVSNKMKDTVVVQTDRYVKHKLYKKYQKIAKKYKADDKGNKCNIRDKVIIEECKPISKTKHFKVYKILN
jgi:small subunit ribosomal protein S17